MNHLQKTDKAIYELIKKEDKRQEDTLMMIPSENTTSYAVEEAIGSSLGNKYAEGYPHRRYYQGQQIVDQVEELAQKRAQDLFKVEAVNVQALSGSPANFAVYTALLEAGDTLMGLSLPSGGHLTHGAARTASSKFFTSVQYDVGKDGLLDYGQIRKIAQKAKPKIIIAGTTAYPRILDWKKFAEIADEVGAYLLADVSHISGLIVTGVYPSPVPFVHVVTTTTHKTLRGPRGALIMTTKKGLAKNPDLIKKINSAIIPGIQGGPHINTIAGIAVALREAGKPSFKTYAKQIVKNAKVLAKDLSSYGFDLVSGGTDSHLILIDLQNKNLIGNTVAEACEAIGIILNRNSIPFDPNPPFYPSGIRLGTPGVTSRGMKEPQMREIASCINLLVEALAKTKKRLGLSTEDEKNKELRSRLIRETKELKSLKSRVMKLCKKFPLIKSY